MSTENLEQEDQNRTTEPIIDIPGNEAPADPEQEIVSQGVHNYNVCVPDRSGCSAAARMVPGSEACADDAFWIVLPARHGCFLGIKRQGFRLVPPPGKLDGRRNLQKTVFQPESFV